MPVEVILKTKIEGLGQRGRHRPRSSPATPRNFLIPKDFAAPATQATKRQVEELKRKRAEREAAEMNEAQELAGKLSKLKLTFILESGEGQEKSFGAITNQDIANKLKEAGHEVDRKKIDLPRPIKELGEHEVTLKLGSEIQATLHIVVEHPAPKAEAATAEAADAKGAKKAQGEKGGLRFQFAPGKTGGNLLSWLGDFSRRRETGFRCGNSFRTRNLIRLTFPGPISKFLRIAPGGTFRWQEGAI